MSIYHSDTITIERESDGSFILKMDVPGRNVNVITRQFLANLDGALESLAGQPRIPVLVVRSGKTSGFLAGADVKEFTRIETTADALALSEAGQKLFDKLAGVNAPTIAVIHGPCLGGGLEFALACDYRLVFDKFNTQLGLPEVELGLLPGWGGTQRLPRVIGLERALQLILTGKRLNASNSFQWGLADAYASNESEFRERFTQLVFRAIGEGKRRSSRLPLRNWRQKILESHLFGRRVIFQAAERRIRARVPDDMPAPIEALAAVRQGIERGFQAGLQREREGAAKLALTPACRNLVGLFLQREVARKPDGIETAREVKRLGVVGAGVMGAGMAQLAALQGRTVIVQEVNEKALSAGLQRIDELFRKAVNRRILSAEAAKKQRAAIQGTISWEGFDSVDLVIEAVIEDLELKRNLFHQMASRTNSSTVLATNTSSLAVATIQEGIANPERIAGMHFFNPIHKMPLVEIVKTTATNDETIALLMRFAIDLGKIPVKVGDGPGFVVNRVLMPYLDEAVRLVAEGMSIKNVDRLMRRFGMPMGPLELLDQIGLDVAANVAKMVRNQRGMPPELNGIFDQMRDKGWLGNKTNLGFYLHKKRGSKPHHAAEKMIRELYLNLKQSMNYPEAARMAEARERMVLLMVNEAAAICSENLATADTIDLAMIFGAGWAPHRGGPLKYAETRGVKDVMRVLEQLMERHGPRFKPCSEWLLRATN